MSGGDGNPSVTTPRDTPHDDTPRTPPPSTSLDSDLRIHQLQENQPPSLPLNTTLDSTAGESFTTCLGSTRSSPPLENASFFTCTSDLNNTSGTADTSGNSVADTSDLEKTLISSTPKRPGQPDFSAFGRTSPPGSQEQGDFESASSCLVLGGNEDYSTEKDASGNLDEEGSSELQANSPSCVVLEEKHNIEIIRESPIHLPTLVKPLKSPRDAELKAEATITSTSSIEVLGSDHKNILDTSTVRNRNSLSNETVKSSTSSVIVLGSSSQSLSGCFPETLQEFSDSDTPFDEAPASPQHVDRTPTAMETVTADTTPTMGMTEEEAYSATMPDEDYLAMLTSTNSLASSQETTSTVFKMSPDQRETPGNSDTSPEYTTPENTTPDLSTPDKMADYSTPDRIPDYSTPDKIPDYSPPESMIPDYTTPNITPNYYPSQSQPITSPSAVLPTLNQLQTPVSRIQSSKNSLPTEQISEEFSVTSDYDVEMSPDSREIDISAEQANIRQTIPGQFVDPETSPVCSPTSDVTYTLQSESIPKSGSQNSNSCSPLSNQSPPNICLSGKNLSDADTETYSVSPNPAADAEIRRIEESGTRTSTTIRNMEHKNLYPEVIVAGQTARLELDPAEIEALKVIEPTEYLSSAETSPDLQDSGEAQEPHALQSFPELNSDSSDTYMPSGESTPYTARSASLISSNYTAPSTTEDDRHTASNMFVTRLATIVPKQDVVTIVNKQKRMLNKLECTNEKVKSCNNLSAQQYEKAAENFKYYTRLLVEMRRDVQVAFKRISSIKTKLANNYPEAWELSHTEAHTDFIHPDDEPDIGSPSPVGGSGTAGAGAGYEEGTSGAGAAYEEPEEPISRSDSYVYVGSYKSDKGSNLPRLQDKGPASGSPLLSSVLSHNITNSSPNELSSFPDVSADVTKHRSVSNNTGDHGNEPVDVSSSPGNHSNNPAVSTYVIEDNDITQIG